MAGFLDAKERVIDVVLTDLGKSQLLRGELRFTYWIPFDDEVDYQPTVTVYNSGSLTQEELDSAIAEKKQFMLEDPVIREASSGRRGLNANEEDFTNMQYAMFSAIPGTGHMSPIPQVSPEMTLSTTDNLSVEIEQTNLIKRQVYKDLSGSVINTVDVDMGFERRVTANSYLYLNYATGSYTSKNFEGFLVTMYHDVSGTLREVVHNRDARANVVYYNDLTLGLVRR